MTAEKRNSNNVGNSNQQGVALFIALIMLFLVTLLGLAAINGTITQGKMAANQYDRQLAFQAASSAMQVAMIKTGAIALATDPLVARDCSTASKNCQINPFTDTGVAAITAAGIHNVASTDYAPTANVSGAPQFVVEYMGQKDTKGAGQLTNTYQYGAENSVASRGTKTEFYRITTRSADPNSVDQRASVTLQAIVGKPSVAGS